MEELTFLEGTPDAGFKKESASFLFNTPGHRRVQAENGWMSFHLVDEGKKIVVASIHFHLTGTLAETPFKAPFGSIEVSSFVPLKSLFEFLQRIETSLKKKGIKTIIVRQPPQSYQPFLAPLSEALFINSGYAVADAEINTSIEVSDITFSGQIDSWELRKLKQAQKSSLEFTEVSIGSLSEVYSFIAACRKERNQSLSLTFEALREIVSRCNESFFLFGVYNDSSLVAAAVTIRVSEKILYNFYSAHASSMDALSPVVLLMDGIYSWCQKNHFEILDLGTSALDKKPNFGLLDFKLRLGGKPSIRYTYQKKLS